MDRKMILLILASTVYFTSALLQDVPDFIITKNPSSTPTGIEGIVTTSSFSCEGRVSRWRACLAHDPTMFNYRIHFQVWRQREDDGSYILVGSNVLLSTTATDIDLPAEVFDTYCVRFEVPQEDQISVIPEDFVGFHIEINGHSSASTGGLLLSGDEAGVILYSEGTKTVTPGEIFPLSSLQQLFRAPLLDAVVGIIAEGSEDDKAPISTSSTSTSPRISPTVYDISSQRILPSKYRPNAYTHSSAHVSPEDASSVNRMTTSPKISYSQWLRPSTSTHTLNPSISAKDIGQDGSIPNGSNDLQSTAVYILVAVGVAIAIVSITLATAAVIFVCKYNAKKQASEGKVIKARAASELINNASYELSHGHAGISTNLRPNSTGYHSHWSLTHNMEQLHSQGECDEGSTYDNPASHKKEEEEENEEERSSEVASVYYSAPIKRVEPTSIFLSDNEAYCSTSPTSTFISENGAYKSRNPTSILASENEAYESGNASGISAESTSGTNTDSVYYTSPTGTSCEEFEVGSNLAYGTSPSNIRLLQ